MNNAMDQQSSLDSGPKGWSLKARISRENTNSRRFSSSNLKSSNIITISSTASSPGYSIRDEIDPSTYSFTTALKALQAKTVYTWEYISSGDGGLTLNSKWNEAEKYICNPLSGEVPLECLSAKTLSSRSFHENITSRIITMSAPLIYPQFQPKSPVTKLEKEVKITIEEKKRSTTRDVGIQSTAAAAAAEVSSGSHSPAPATPSIGERLLKQNVTESTEDSSPDSSGKQTSHAEVMQVEVKERGERNSRKGNEEGRERNKGMINICCMWSCSSRRRRRGRLSFKSILWQKTRKLNDNNPSSSPTFLLHHFNACYKD